MTADKRRIAACLKACEGISTQNLEDNVPVLELALRYNAVLRERDALRAKIEQMEQQEPVGAMLEVSPHNYELRWYRSVPFGANLYTLPGAKGENAMAEKRIEVRTIMVRLMCDKCGEGEMKPTGVALMSHPPQYPHKCDKCGAATTIRGGKTYPAWSTRK